MKSYLPINYTPTAYDVICAKGKNAFGHAGNARFRVAIEVSLTRFRNARTKIEKSVVISEIIDNIKSNNSGFIRFENKSGLYYYIGEEATREKVGQTLREAMIKNDPEKSTQKKMRRRILRQERNNGKDPAAPVVKLPMPEVQTSAARGSVVLAKQEFISAYPRMSLSPIDEAIKAMPHGLNTRSSYLWFDPEQSDSELTLESLDSELLDENLDQLMDLPLINQASIHVAV